MADKRSESKPQQEEEAVFGNSANLTDLIRALAQHGGIPITLSQTALVPIDTGKLLSQQPRRTVAFPPCADELLALIRTNNTDEITGFFKEYFKFYRHRIFGEYATTDVPRKLVELELQLGQNIDQALLNCGAPAIESHTSTTMAGPRTAVSAAHASPSTATAMASRTPRPDRYPRCRRSGTLCRRLDPGSSISEQLGVFQILGVILDAFASNGRIPISNRAVADHRLRHEIAAWCWRRWLARRRWFFTVRDRAAHRTCLGWVSTSGRKLKLDTEVNTGFNTLFHQFIFHALEFFNVRRMGVAIRGSAAPAPPPSVATLITISDTIEMLKKRFEVFDYGRNYYNTLSGIVWAIGGMSIIRELSTTLGIPPAFSDPHEFIPAAYDLLVLKRPVTTGTTNRYLTHRECARNGRDILLDLEVINHQDKNPNGELEAWLTQVEAKVEAYRTAYRSLTGVDLGVAGTPAIEQQV